MDALCLWISNRRCLSEMNDSQLSNRRCTIINTLGGISDFIRKSSLSTIQQITNKAIKNTDYRDLISITTFKTLLFTILKNPSNLSWIQHQKLYNVLNNASFITLEQRTKIKDIQINVNYLSSPIYRMDNDQLSKILSFSEFHEYCVMKTVCVSWMFSICALADYDQSFVRSPSNEIDQLAKVFKVPYSTMICYGEAFIENILHVVQNQFMQNPMFDWRKKLVVDSKVFILNRSNDFVEGTVTDVDEFTKYIQITFEHENEWVSRYSSRIQCVSSINPKTYAKAIKIVSNIIIPWMLAQKTSISNIKKKVNRILNQLHILENRQSEFMFNGYLVYLLDVLHERMSMPPNSYFLCICLINFMLQYYNRKQIDIDSEALICAMWRSAAIQTDQLHLLAKINQHIAGNKLDIIQINKIDAHLNKLMAKHNIYTFVTPYTFASIYSQSILSKISSNSRESSTKSWKETRKLIVKQMKQMVSDSKAFRMYPSKIAKSSIYNVSAKLYPNTQLD